MTLKLEPIDQVKLKVSKSASALKVVSPVNDHLEKL